MDLARRLSKTVFVRSGMECRSCGSVPIQIGNSASSICNFCEAQVSTTKDDVKRANGALEAGLSAIHSAICEGRWKDALRLSDGLTADDDPHFLYGIGNLYMALSDTVYRDVDYTLRGFMEKNSQNRSDEYSINKYNAMQLASKARESLFRFLKVSGANSQANTDLDYLEMVAEIRVA